MLSLQAVRAKFTIKVDQTFIDFALAGLPAAGSFGIASPAMAQDAACDLKGLGKVSFDVACTPAAQDGFNHAMAVYH